MPEALPVAPPEAGAEAPLVGGLSSWHAAVILGASDPEPELEPESELPQAGEGRHGAEHESGAR